jgi:zinc transporter, ZIP family
VLWSGVLDAFAAWPAVWQALAATLFTWGVTALGAGAVFFFKDVSRKALDSALGFTAGVMIAASFWSLLNPAIALSEEMGMVKWVPALVGFLSGAFSMRLVDYILPHVHLFGTMTEAEGSRRRGGRRRCSCWRSRCTTSRKDWRSAWRSAPWPPATSRRRWEPPSRWRWASAFRTPGGDGDRRAAAPRRPVARQGVVVRAVVGRRRARRRVVGALAVTMMRPILPYALAFAAGAMIFVVVEEVIPESQSGGHGDLATLGAMIGFAVMMTLDVALG